jgi:WD40 repeat protein
MFRLAGIFFLFSFISCSGQALKIIRIDPDKDLIPEGIAVHEGRIFLSSIYKNKIVFFDTKTNTASDFIAEKQHGFRSGVGMLIKENLLFALSNDNHKDSLTSALYIFNLSNKKQVGRFELRDNQKHFFNDLTINKLNQVFITDSRHQAVYKLDYPAGKIELFLSSPDISFPNGITLSDDEKKMFIASSNKGLKIYDLTEKKLVDSSFNETKGIDGMKFYKSTIYAVRNTDKNPEKHGLYAIILNEESTGVKQVKPLLTGHSLMNIPTTLDIDKNYIYILANSQMDNLDESENKLIREKDLKHTYVIRLRIKH